MTMDALALNGLVALPTGFVLLLVLGGRRSDVAALSVAVVGGLAVLGWSVWAVAVSAVGLDGGHVDVPWVDAVGIRWHLGLDGISGPLVLMTTVIVACCLLSLVRQPPAGGARSAPRGAAAAGIEAGARRVRRWTWCCSSRSSRSR